MDNRLHGLNICKYNEEWMSAKYTQLSQYRTQSTGYQLDELSLGASTEYPTSSNENMQYITQSGGMHW